MKLTILNFIRNALHRAQEAEKRALIDSGCAEACAEVWHKHNPMDGVGGISRCPYNPVIAKEEAEKKAEELEHLEQTYQFALETFLYETDDS